MDFKKLIIGTIVGAVVFFLLGKLIYGSLLYHFMGQNPGEIGLIGRRQVKFVFLAAGHLAQGLLLTWILLRSNVGSLIGGLTTGAIAGFLMLTAVSLIVYDREVEFQINKEEAIVNSSDSSQIELHPEIELQREYLPPKTIEYTSVKVEIENK